jgi:hypothetical protein
MKNHLIAIAAALCTSLAGGAFAADGMSKDAYKADKNRIEAEAKDAKKACLSMKDNAKDICQAEAKAKEKVAKAELDAKNHPNARADAKVSQKKAEGEYEVAKEKCEDLKGGAIATCKKDAKTAYDKVKAEARQASKATDAKKS